MAITRLGHVEFYVADLERSRHFYVDVLGMVETERTADRLYLRCAEEYEHHSFVLTQSDRKGLAHLSFRVDDEGDLEQLAHAYEAQGIQVLRLPAGAERGQGAAIRLRDPIGFPVEFYHKMDRVERKMRTHRGISPLRIDHVNLRVGPSPDAAVKYYKEQLGFYMSEYALKPDGSLFGAWVHRKQTTHDVALVSGPSTFIHHAAIYVADNQMVVNTADVLADAKMASSIEYGPGRHGLTNAFFCYIKDPDDNRIEVYSGDYLIADPDYEPIKWTHDEFLTEGRLLWGGKAPDSFQSGQPISDWTQPPTE